MKYSSTQIAAAMTLTALVALAAPTPAHAGLFKRGKAKAKVTHTRHASVVREVRAERADGPKARIALGDFRVKATGASAEIGDGLREMLVTALFTSGEFIVLERQAVSDVMLEQDLGASGRVRQGTGAPIGELEGAEILVYGVVSEFQLGKGGRGMGFRLPNTPTTFGGSVNKAHMAIDLRAVDTETGRILLATRVEGKARDWNVRVQTVVGGGSSLMPVSLGTYHNTPMEKAIRYCIDAAVDYLASEMPAEYFHSASNSAGPRRGTRRSSCRLGQLIVR